MTNLLKGEIRITTVLTVSTQPVPKRRFRTIEEKQRILAEATAPGASVALVARKHGVNANLVFGWMRLRKAGLLGTASEPAALLPVEVGTPTVLPDRATRPAPASQVAIEFPGGIIVRVHGQIDREALIRVISALRR